MAALPLGLRVLDGAVGLDPGGLGPERPGAPDEPVGGLPAERVEKRVVDVADRALEVGLLRTTSRGRELSGALQEVLGIQATASS